MSIDKFTLLSFSVKSNPELYFAYLKLKYDIFVKELGWKKLPYSITNKIMEPDHYDAMADFIIVKNGNKTVGVTRVIKIQNDFPHKFFFEPILQVKVIQPFQNKLATLNSVAVKKEYRGMKLFNKGITIGEFLLVKSVEHLQKQGAKIVFITTNPNGQSGVFFRKLGFYTISSQFAYPHSPTILVNMALVINDKERFINLNSPMLANCKTISKDERAMVQYLILNS
ncbi:MAG: GNAT family N-acetyltransferase [Candidatus Marithrix sp.]|nr:GNAT family N-acetyltransferase [Candidatus Marithrix sp.]